jgi:hypothetical protein
MMDQSQIDNISWGNIDKALLAVRCPWLPTLHLKFVSGDLVITGGEVRECLSMMSSEGVVNVVISNSSYIIRARKLHCVF